METGEGDWIWRSRRRGVSLLVAQLEVALGLAPEACLGWGLGQRNKWREGGREEWKILGNFRKWECRGTGKVAKKVLLQSWA